MKAIRFYALTKTKVITEQERDRACKRGDEINRLLNSMSDPFSEQGVKLWDEWFEQFDILNKYAQQHIKDWARRIAAEKRNKPK